MKDEKSLQSADTETGQEPVVCACVTWGGVGVSVCSHGNVPTVCSLSVLPLSPIRSGHAPEKDEVSALY